MPYLNKIVSTPEPVDCRILTAALDLFVERGFHNVSVHDVQKEANVSIGSIYNHFGGKEGIAKALYYHLLNEFEEMINGVIEEDLSNRERCNKIILQLFEYTESRRNIISYMLHAKHREFLPNEPPICSSTPFTSMRKIVQQGIDAGEIRPGNPWVVAASVFGGAIRMIHLRLDGVIKEPLTQYYDEVIDCIWRGMNPGEVTKSRQPRPVEMAN
ncbi:MAG: TetR family transcriptional regulator [Sedimenticola sp.]|jgi:AcrR family transcriptional regulator|nr:MAG: TetR family transcriptional regulator [Sedimenticola sp.]